MFFLILSAKTIFWFGVETQGREAALVTLYTVIQSSNPTPGCLSCYCCLAVTLTRPLQAVYFSSDESSGLLFTAPPNSQWLGLLHCVYGNPRARTDRCLAATVNPTAFVKLCLGFHSHAAPRRHCQPGRRAQRGCGPLTSGSSTVQLSANKQSVGVGHPLADTHGPTHWMCFYLSCNHGDKSFLSSSTADEQNKEVAQDAEEETQ